ncbi:restriction endonuclease subunit S [Lacticaseibacillus kribbianus]|uniref:restriction endonuclease subunit S n=1 Tax=Lacticaseibacillus kribbianus TaxID=2926292 RepID=UPI001CD68C7E|nr:restriction endonuclease subunit S [Lacticaseibacillus kribbianus]
MSKDRGKQRLIPTIRFKGFTDDWEQRKLSDVATFWDSQRIPVTASDRVPGETPYYGANGIQDHIEGYTHEGTYVLIAEDGANDLINYPVQIIEGRSWVNNHAHVVQGITAQLDTKFLAYRISSMDISRWLVGGGRAKLNGEVLQKMPITIPRSEEQTMIRRLLSNLDKTLVLHQRKYENLQAVKKELLKRMFASDKKPVPDFRFNGYTNDWEQRKLSDVATFWDSQRIPVTASDRVPGETPYYGANGIQDHIEGYTHEGTYVLIAEDGANDLINYPVQIIEGRSWVNNHAHVVQGITAQLDTKFLAYRISSMDISRWLVGGGRAKLNGEVLQKMPITIPRSEEQTMIRRLLSNLDKTLVLHQRKLEDLKQLKKVLLQKLFV